MEEVIAQLTTRVDELEKMTHTALGLVIALFVALFAVGFFYLGCLVTNSTEKGK